MADQSNIRLGELQLKILKILWGRGPSTVAEVREQLYGESLAYTTIATMLRKMENRELVRHREQGRKYIYEATLAAKEVTRSMADQLVDRIFDGSLSATVSHLLETREVDPEELARLEALIRARKNNS